MRRVPAAPQTKPDDATDRGERLPEAPGRTRKSGRRAAGEGTIYRDGKYLVAEVQWTDENGTNRRRRKRTTRTAAVAA